MNNTNIASEFILSCLKEIEQKELIGVIFIVIYIITLFGNITVIVIVVMDQQLQRPMYLCIVVLSVIDLTCSTSIVLKILAILLFKNARIPYSMCVLQMFILHQMEILEIFLLTLMAFDRYVAVTNPLRYASIITNKTILISIAILNVIGLTLVTLFQYFAASFHFCSTNILPYCFCDFTAMLRIACFQDDRYIIVSSTVSAVCIIFTFLLILLSYFRIIQVALKTAKADGRMKAVSTCFTHLLIVGLFYIPLFFSYVIPASRQISSSTVTSSMIMVSTIIPPLLNPLIYSLRNNEIKQSMQKIITRKALAGFTFN
ncbi:O10G6 protein, partial [Polypterus senegalus]|nr:O10G6 protein [Polypterus senegalus]